MVHPLIPTLAGSLPESTPGFLIDNHSQFSVHQYIQHQKFPHLHVEAKAFTQRFNSCLNFREVDHHPSDYLRWRTRSHNTAKP